MAWHLYLLRRLPYISNPHNPAQEPSRFRTQVRQPPDMGFARRHNLSGSGDNPVRVFVQLFAAKLLPDGELRLPELLLDKLRQPFGIGVHLPRLSLVRAQRETQRRRHIIADDPVRADAPRQAGAGNGEHYIHRHTLRLCSVPGQVLLAGLYHPLIY